MLRTMFTRILKSSKPYFRSMKTQSSSSIRCCFNSRAHQSHQNLIITSWQNNPSVVQCRRRVCSQSVTTTTTTKMIERFDALCEERKVREAIQVLDLLEDKDYVMDLPRLLGLAKLCGKAKALEEGRIVHDCIIISSSSESDVESSHIHNTIIEMYFACGSVKDVLKVFDEMPEREKTSKTFCVMMKCLAENGEGELAIDLFTRFKSESTQKPDKEMFKTVFAVCTSLFDIHEGLLHFESMYKDYNIIPSMEDYVSVTEMLASCGYLDEAIKFVERMSVEPSVEIWETLMNLCWIHGDLNRGDKFAGLVKKLDPARMKKEYNVGLVIATKTPEVLESSENLRKRQKKPMREFKAGDTSHPESDRIFSTLRSLKVHMLEMGFVPETRVYTGKAEDREDKEEQLLFRSDKMAITYGLLHSNARSVITVWQNMRICIDGHNTLKMISLITGRELVKRDSKRFHYVKNGVCVCDDYW